MEKIKILVEEVLMGMNLSAEYVALVRHVVLVVVAVVLAAVAGWTCKQLVPWVVRLTRRTPSRWDEALLNERVLRSACQIVPAVVVWMVLPSVFSEYPMAHETLARLTAIYITVMTTRTIIVFADSFHRLDSGARTARQQYLYSFIGVLKIVLIFIAAIVVVSIAIDKDPSTLLAGLGAASAILMLAFQDTIKGLVAGIRLTSNEMVAVGDRITVGGAGADGIVEEITLTTVKVRNFDNTIVTVSPQTLVDGSFQNWKGMKEKSGRKAVRRLYIDYRSIHTVRADVPKGNGAAKGNSSAKGNDAADAVNLTLYRRHMEQWLAQHPHVLKESIIMVHQLDATPTGLPLEFVFWLDMQDVLPYEHTIADIMEYAYAQANEYGLRVYQTLTIEN